MELKTGDFIEFDRKKVFKYIKQLGQGGTGDTRLFEDETTNIQFAFKKYVSQDKDNVDENYKRFVDEIKILFNLSHLNIVRVYNYYLYPQAKTGYLQMEYIQGESIDDFIPFNDKYWDEIFTQAIAAFEYLESNNILHRDIRPANILIDKNSKVKIIDFGFGKKLEKDNPKKNSILLNWPVTELPNEVINDNDYDHQTEVFFVGKLFQRVFKENDYNSKYLYIIERMTKVDKSERYKSFGAISESISKGNFGEINFSEADKEIYLNFADSLSRSLICYTSKYSPRSDVLNIIALIEKLIVDSSLEKYIQDNLRLARCFVTNGIRYSNYIDIEVKAVVDFYGLLKSLSNIKQKIVLDNIFTRLSKVQEEDSEEIPF